MQGASVASSPAAASAPTNVLYHCRPCARTLPTRDLAKHLAGKPHLACQSAADARHQKQLAENALVQPRIVVSGVSTKYGMWECVPCQRSMMRVTRASHLRGAPHAKMVAEGERRKGKEVAVKVQEEAEREKQKQMRDELEAIEQATRRREEAEAEAQRELELERQRRMREELEAIEQATRKRQEAEREKQRQIQEEKDRLEAIEREREREMERERLVELRRVQGKQVREIERAFREKQEAEQEEQRQKQREMEARTAELEHAQKAEQEQQRQRQREMEARRAQLEREIKEGEEERARQKQARRDAGKQRKEAKRNMKELQRASWMEAKQQREEEEYRRLAQQDGDTIERAVELRPLAGSTTPGGSVQSNGGDGFRSKMLEYLQSQGALQQDGLDLAPVEAVEKPVTEFERTGYVSRLVPQIPANTVSTIPMFASTTDLPPVLYRVYDETSVSKYSWLGFIAMIPHLPDDPLYFRSMVQRHGNWSCRQGTPFVSVTASPDAAGWHIAKKQTSGLPTNIMVALVDTAALLRATRVWKMHDAMDHFGLQPWGCERRAYDNEYICAGGIPASAVFACCQPEYYMDVALVFMKNMERREAEKTRSKGMVVTIRAPDEVVEEVSVEGGCLIPYGANDFAA